MKIGTILHLLALVAVLFGILLIIPSPKETPITNFDECIAAGNPVMESYPRQCRANDQTFVEELVDQNLDPNFNIEL